MRGPSVMCNGQAVALALAMVISLSVLAEPEKEQAKSRDPGKPRDELTRVGIGASSHDFPCPLQYYRNLQVRRLTAPPKPPS